MKNVDPTKFRIKFITTDGNLVMDRHSHPDYYFSCGQPCQQFINLVLKKDSADKGVRIVSYTLDKATGIVAIVDWLK